MSVRTSSAPIIVFVFASLALHLASYAWLNWAWRLPNPGFELALPAIIELGVVEGTMLQSPPAAAEPTPHAAPPSPAPEPARTASEPTPKPAGPAAADEPPKPPPRSKPSKRSAARAAARRAVASEGLAALSPPGAQLALRVDLDRIRDSVLAEDVQGLLAAIPDVRFILEGSEIEPVRDLSRLFLASPNLQRSRLVLAGKYRGDERLPREAAERLARARGKPISWQTQGTVPVVAWENLDSTERVLALIGPNLFAITRAEDLARVLGIAEALVERQRANDARKQISAGDALLAMDEDQVVAFSVENAKLFTRGATENIPERLTLSARAPHEGMIQLTTQAAFATEADASAAMAFWDGLKTQYARSPIVAILGLSGLLDRTTLQRKQAQIVARSSLSIDEARLMLRFLRDALSQRRGAANLPSSQPSTPVEAP